MCKDIFTYNASKKYLVFLVWTILTPLTGCWWWKMAWTIQHLYSLRVSLSPNHLWDTFLIVCTVQWLLLNVCVYCLHMWGRSQCNSSGSQVVGAVVVLSPHAFLPRIQVSLIGWCLLGKLEATDSSRLCQETDPSMKHWGRLFPGTVYRNQKPSNSPSDHHYHHPLNGCKLWD